MIAVFHVLCWASLVLSHVKLGAFFSVRPPHTHFAQSRPLATVAAFQVDQKAIDLLARTEELLVGYNLTPCIGEEEAMQFVSLGVDVQAIDEVNLLPKLRRCAKTRR